ncbi:MAG: hypothetical protein IKT91_04815 [Clostridia bacterium]|nr:hypothetical protein [Clostridia bacterium]
MKEIKINIPEYDDAIELIWDDNFKIKTSIPYDKITIEANREGLLSLARHLLLLAQEEVPNGSHFHLDDFNSLENNSVELIIAKNNNL